MRPYSRSRAAIVTAILLGAPTLVAAADDEVQPAFRPIQANHEFALTGNGFGLNPWGANIWAPSPFQWPFNQRVEVAAPGQFQFRQLGVLPPALTPPIGPMFYPRPMPIFPRGGGGGGGGMLPGQGASGGGDDGPAGTVLSVNYANMFGTAAQQLRAQQPNFPIMPYPYPYGGGFFPR